MPYEEDHFQRIEEDRRLEERKLGEEDRRLGEKKSKFVICIGFSLLILILLVGATS